MNAGTGTKRGARPLRRLLMVLDHRLRHVAEDALANGEWFAEWVSSAAEGISRLEVVAFDAVLTQAELSDSTGRELLDYVLSQKSALPVVFLAFPGGEREIALALEHGAAGYAVAGPGLPLLLPAALEHAVRTGRSRGLERRSRDLQHRSELRALCTALRHELNNPLTGILGNAEMGLATPALPPLIERRLRAIARMAEQIRDVLAGLEHVPDQPTHLLDTAESRK